MIVIGIDPGIMGGIAVIRQVHTVLLYPMPIATVKRKVVDARELYELLSTFANVPFKGTPVKVFLEETAFQPSGGGFRNGISVGYTRGLIEMAVTSLGYELRRVSASTWKRDLGLLKADKAGSRMRAGELYPDCREQFKRVKDDGVAEALLIAHWGVHYSK